MNETTFRRMNGTAFTCIPLTFVVKGFILFKGGEKDKNILYSDQLACNKHSINDHVSCCVLVTAGSICTIRIFID